jgi:DNA (cytosine-5)-methyltransferase 1
MVFDEVHSDLESAGYEVQAVVIPAAAVNAPHGRDRVWFVATNTNRSTTGSSRTSERVESNGGNGHLFTEQRRESSKLNNRLHEFSWDVTNANGDGFYKRNGNDEVNPSEGRINAQCNTNTGDVNGDVADSHSGGLEGTKEVRRNGINVERESQFGATSDTIGIGLQRKRESTKLEGGRFSFDNTQNNKTTWDNFPTQSPICGGDDGIPTQLDGITFSKWRNESIKAYGNAIVPQVAYEIFKAIQRTI